MSAKNKIDLEDETRVLDDIKFKNKELKKKNEDLHNLTMNQVGVLGTAFKHIKNNEEQIQEKSERVDDLKRKKNLAVLPAKHSLYSGDESLPLRGGWDDSSRFCYGWYQPVFGERVSG